MPLYITEYIMYMKIIDRHWSANRMKTLDEQNHRIITTIIIKYRERKKNKNKMKIIYIYSAEEHYGSASETTNQN